MRDGGDAGQTSSDYRQGRHRHRCGCQRSSRSEAGITDWDGRLVYRFLLERDGKIVECCREDMMGRCHSSVAFSDSGTGQS